MPTSWDDLQARPPPRSRTCRRTKEWCIGLESGRGVAAGRAPTGSRTSSSARPVRTSTTSGSPASRSGPRPEIKSAWQEFGKAVSAAYGDPTSIDGDELRRRRRTSSSRRPPGCLFHHQASFITSFFDKGTAGIKAGTDYQLLPVPGHRPGERRRGRRARGDLFGMFNDTPQAKSLMKYLVTARGPGHLGRSSAARSPAARPSRPTSIPMTSRRSRPPRSRAPRSSASTPRMRCRSR